MFSLFLWHLGLSLMAGFVYGFGIYRRYFTPRIIGWIWTICPVMNIFFLAIAVASLACKFSH